MRWQLLCFDMETNLGRKLFQFKPWPVDTLIINDMEHLDERYNITCPDVLSNVYQIAPVWPSLSTGIVTEPRIVLFQIISQSYIVTLICRDHQTHRHQSSFTKYKMTMPIRSFCKKKPSYFWTGLCLLMFMRSKTNITILKNYNSGRSRVKKSIMII